MKNKRKMSINELQNKERIGRWIVTVGKKDDKEPEKNSHQIKIPHQAKIPIEKKKDKEHKDINSQAKLF
jgi:hypothetical protein